MAVKKRTHKKREVVGTQKRKQKRASILDNQKNDFLGSKEFEFDPSDFDFDFDLYLKGLEDPFEQIKATLSDPIEIVDLKASNDVKRASKRSSEKKLRGQK